MKQFLMITTIGLFTILFTNQATAQDFPNLDKSPLDVAYYPPRAAFRAFAKTEEAKKADMPIIRVLYSRPQKKDRDIFGSLEKFGTTWRLGANESTEIQFFRDVEIGGSTIPAGRYTIYATLGENEWAIRVNKAVDGWGAYAYNADMDIASVKVPVEKTEDTIEAFSIVFAEAEGGATMIMGWDDTIVRVPIGF